MEAIKAIMENYVKYGVVKKAIYDNLSIYNYTTETQFKGDWNYYSKMARGLILDEEGTIVARPMPKFFNLNEIDESAISNLPNEIPEVSTKLDGSMIISYFHKDKLRFATRGSFDSDQAKWAMELFNKKYSHVNFDKYRDFTFCFEAIYTLNRIVVDYGELEDLFLLAVIHKEGGWDYTYNDVRKIADELGLKSVFSELKSFDEMYADLKKNPINFEGYVLRYSNGLRVKCKTEEYCRLHRLMTGISEKAIWEVLKNKDDLTKFLDRVPDEFHRWFDTTRNTIQHNYENIEQKAKLIFNDTPKFDTRKEYALSFKEKADSSLMGILFSMLDNQDYSEIIWKMVKPKTGQTFRILKEDESIL